MRITFEQQQQHGGAQAIRDAVAGYKQAVKKHQKTVGQPAPIAPDLIINLAKTPKTQWAFEPDPAIELEQRRREWLASLDPMQLLREERNKRLSEFDNHGRDTLAYLRRGQLIPAAIQDYIESLCNLPEDIAAGKIPAPTLDEDGNLVFAAWPVPPSV